MTSTATEATEAPEEGPDLWMLQAAHLMHPPWYRRLCHGRRQDLERAEALLHQAAHQLVRQKRLAQAGEALQQRLACLTELQRPADMAKCYEGLATLARQRQDVAATHACTKQAAKLFMRARQYGHAGRMWVALGYLSRQAFAWEEALWHYRRAAIAYETASSPTRSLSCLVEVANMDLVMGRTMDAVAMYRDVLPAAVRAEATVGRAVELIFKTGMCYLALNQVRQAVQWAAHDAVACYRPWVHTDEFLLIAQLAWAWQRCDVAACYEAVQAYHSAGLTGMGTWFSPLFTAFVHHVQTRWVGSATPDVGAPPPPPLPDTAIE